MHKSCSDTSIAPQMMYFESVLNKNQETVKMGCAGLLTSSSTKHMVPWSLPVPCRDTIGSVSQGRCWLKHQGNPRTHSITGCPVPWRYKTLLLKKQETASGAQRMGAPAPGQAERGRAAPNGGTSKDCSLCLLSPTAFIQCMTTKHLVLTLFIQ